MKILAVILFLGIMLSSCGNKADSERLNDSALTMRLPYIKRCSASGR